jgi:hypothetical protein
VDRLDRLAPIAVGFRLSVRALSGAVTVAVMAAKTLASLHQSRAGWLCRVKATASRVTCNGRVLPG